MSTIRKKLIGILAVLFCTLLVLSTALMIPKNKTAEATSVGTVVEIYDSSANKFSAKGLRKLYTNIYSGAITYNKLKSKLDNTNGTVLRSYSQMTPTTVSLGGYNWNLVAVSKNQQGDVIATLWLSKSEYTSTFSKSDFKDDSASTYSPSEYSMSLVRSTLMGGDYASTLTTTETGTQAPIWEAFLDKYHNYIDTPYQVCGETGYQATEKYYDPSEIRNYLHPNEAYKKYTEENIGLGKWMNANVKAVQDTTNYALWQGDELWLPSLSETGYASIYTGLWDITSNTVRADATESWLRSADFFYNFAAVSLEVSGGAYNGRSGSVYSYGVRPAFHLNLSKAAAEAKGVAYDDVDPKNVDDGSKEVTNTETEHIFEHVYDGNKVEIELLNRANLSIVGADYSPSSGKFTATYPEQKHDASNSGDKTYTITVEPNTGYVWDDTDQGGTREYKITVSLAEIAIDPLWGDTSCALGESLLQQDTTAIQVKGNDSQPSVVYWVADPPGTGTPPDVSEWETEDDGDFTSSKTGNNRVHYYITADYHKYLKGFFDVRVNADTEITLTGSIADTSTTYGNETAEALLDLLKGKFSGVTFTGDKSGAYDSDRVSSLWDNVEIVLYKDGKAVGPQSNGYYAAGTYEIYLKSKDNAVTFKWSIDHPKVTISPAEIVVKVVAATDGDKLTHVYGDNPAAFKIVLSDGTTKLSDGGEVGDLAFGDYILQTTDKGDIVLDKTTPVCKGVVIADASKILNYKVVDFETTDSDYEVTQRTVKLFVADETVGYGTDFTKYEFKLKFVEGESLVNNETLPKVITSTTYTIKSIAGASFKLSDTLYIGEYVINATAEAVNYKFEITAGKLTVEKGTFDLSGVDLENAGYIYDGEPHPAKLEGDLPSDEIKVSYRYVNYNTGEELDSAPVEVGLYLVYASFSHDNSNYNVITEVKAAYIRIAYTQEELNQAYPDLPTDADLAAAADLAKKKDEAKKTLDEEAQKKKDEIDADVNLTPEEKKAAKDEIDEELKKGNEAIDKAKDKDGVNKAYDDGKKEIEDTAELVEKKGAAKSELDKAAQAKKDAIDANPDLTDEERRRLKPKSIRNSKRARKRLTVQQT